jgi:ABC-type Fe3+-citrate transport system substrate-binding protein
LSPSKSQIYSREFFNSGSVKQCTSFKTIAYYLNHRQEIDNYLEQRNQQAQQLRQQLTQKHSLVDLRERLLARQSQKEAGQNALSI